MTNLTAQFKAYLIQKDLSSVSVKNYVSDINKFLKHLRGDRMDSSKVDLPSEEDFKNYYNKINQNNTPSQTLKRYQSSLRKFGQFLQDEYLMPKNPAVIITTSKDTGLSAKQIDLEKMLDVYRKSLEKAGAKPATVKNYLADTRQFIDFIGNL